jgi:hypothetical protein
MSKKINKLQEAAEKVQARVAETNNKISELGNYTYSLNNVLNIIQTQFDKIRNIPSDKHIEYDKIKKARLTWTHEVETIEANYKSSQTLNVGSGAAGAATGVGVVTLAPTAAMSIATTFGVASTGTAISSLSGAAATNAALAWLGGGTLAAGGGGMAGGSALLALSGPVGWSIAGVALLGGGILFWLTSSDKQRIEKVFSLISDRDIDSYDLSIVELNERISRILQETKLLNNAIVEIGSFGTDYTQMTEEQQYTLGTYLNQMNSSTQLLVNPIMGLQPKYSEKDLMNYLSCHNPEEKYREKSIKELLIYMANLLFDIKIEEKDRKLLAKSYRKDKKFLENMKVTKKDIDLALFNKVDELLKFKVELLKK